MSANKRSLAVAFVALLIAGPVWAQIDDLLDEARDGLRERLERRIGRERSSAAAPVADGPAPVGSLAPVDGLSETPADSAARLAAECSENASGSRPFTPCAKTCSETALALSVPRTEGETAVLLNLCVVEHDRAFALISPPGTPSRIPVPTGPASAKVATANNIAAECMRFEAATDYPSLRRAAQSCQAACASVRAVSFSADETDISSMLNICEQSYAAAQGPPTEPDKARYLRSKWGPAVSRAREGGDRGEAPMYLAGPNVGGRGVVQLSRKVSSEGPFAADIGIRVETTGIRDIFQGISAGGQGTAFRTLFVAYAKASDQYCGAKTPNGTTVIVKETTSITKDAWGNELDRILTKTEYQIDIALADNFLAFARSTAPDFFSAPITVWSEIAEHAWTDYSRLLKSWECAGPEVKQFQANLVRAISGMPSLQAEYFGQTIVARAREVQAAREAARLPTRGPKMSDDSLIVRLRGQEFREQDSGSWCGRVARMDRFYDPNDDYVSGLVIGSPVSTIMAEIAPLLNAECPQAALLEVFVFEYGNPELISADLFEWDRKDAQWVRRTMNVVPENPIGRRNVVYAP